MRPGPLLAWMVVAAVAATASATTSSNRRRPLIQAFPLADVQLAAGSEFAANHEQNNHYLLLLDPDNLLWCFRDNAGLEAPGEAYGGWEWVDVEIRGQFIGHYMSALAFAAQTTGRPEFFDRGKLIVNELRKVQDAIGTGYLSAFPVSHFERLEALQGVWAPYYVIHKIMAGFLDQHQLAGAEGALEAVEWMADYFCGRVRHVLETNGTDVWNQILEVEFGGMNEVLYNLYSATGNRSYAECARWFDKPSFLQPLLAGRDPMPGLHANTHLAQVQGFAARYEHLGDPQGLLAVRHFFNLMVQHHTFSTGGSNWYEHWGPEDRLGDALNDTGASQMTEESCTQYNILKIARYLFRFTGEPALADFYERAILNDVIGIQKMPHSHQLGGHPHPHGHSHAPFGSHSAHPHGPFAGSEQAMLAGQPQRQQLLQEQAGQPAAGSNVHSHSGSSGSEASLAGRGGSGRRGGRGAVSGSSSSPGGDEVITLGDRDSHKHESSLKVDRRTHVHIHTSHMHGNSSVQIHIHVHNDESSGAGNDTQPSGGVGSREGAASAASQRRRRLQRSYGRRFDPSDLPDELQSNSQADVPAELPAAAAEASNGRGSGADWRQQLARMQPRPEQVCAEAERRVFLQIRAAFFGEALELNAGLFIYYLPLGTGMDKLSKGGWTHGFGTPFNSFWCCYGTAVESFAKLADSIYFKTMPEEPPSASSRGAPAGSSFEGSPVAASAGRTGSEGSPAGASEGRADAGAGGSADGGPPPELLPQLFVNQLVSSSVRWRELRVVAHQQAEIYGPETAAVSRLTLEIYPPEGQAAAAGAEPEQRRFALNWRIPGWAKASEVQLRVNGRNITACAEGAAAAEAQGALGLHRGCTTGCNFCSLGNTWTNGDVVEAYMPMRVVTEELTDSRPEFRSRRAVMMGPLLMAGLTHDTNELDADPSRIEDAISLPNATALLSLALPAAAAPAHPATASSEGSSQGQPPLLLRHCAGGELALGPSCPGGGGVSPLDATFRLAAPLAGCEAGGSAVDVEGCSAGPDRQLLMQPAQGSGSKGDGVLRPASGAAGGYDGPPPSAGPQLVSFEATSAPGHFLTADSGTGRLVLRQARTQPAAAQTFRLHPVPAAGADGSAPGGTSNGQPAYELEPLSQPGTRIQLTANSPEGSDGPAVAFAAETGAGSRPGSAAAAFQLAPPAAPAYPRGARVLNGHNRDYLLVPLGQIMDESYTAYFKFAAEAALSEFLAESPKG
ncbi:hypothetical protein ABPG75_000463 [Micractinium tetrahymenae]